MRGKINPLLLLPVALFAGFCGLMALQIMRADSDGLPSTLVGRTAPEFEPGQLGQFALPGRDALLAPGPKLVNFWASWCPPCRAEHPNLVLLASSGLQVIGINYKDTEANGLAFLEELGNPYSAVGTDADGKLALDWGVYGIPETFILDGNGTVLYRHAGPITGRVLQDTILPEIKPLIPDSMYAQLEMQTR